MTDKLSRRHFLKSTIAAGAAAFSPQALLAGGKRRMSSLTDKARLGRTGVEVSYLGIGTGTVGNNHESNQTRLGPVKFTRMINHAFDQGITYFDCADTYGSHDYLKRSLVRIPREKYVLQTKIWFRTSKDAREALDRFRKELGTDYLDIVFLHCVTDPNWGSDLKEMQDVLEEAKQKKIIRAHGLSIHDLRVLQGVADNPWVDNVFSRINPLGAVMDGKPDEVVPALEKIHAAGKGVTGMKIMGEGRIADKREQSLRYVLGLGCVDAIVIGFESTAQIDDVLAIGKKALA